MAQSYVAGQLLVPVKPDARGAAAKVRAEFANMPDPVVEIDAEISRLQRAKATALAELDQLRAARADASIGAKITELESAVARADAELDTLRGKDVTAEIGARITELETAKARATAELDQLNGMRAEASAGLRITELEADVARADAQIDQLSAKRAEVTGTGDFSDIERGATAVDVVVDRLDGRRATVTIIADVARALSSLAGLAVALAALDDRPSTVRVGIDAASAIAGLALVAARAFALGGAVGAVSSLAAAVMSLGPAGAVAAGGLAAAVLGFGGVGKALTALSAQQDTAGKDAQEGAKKQAQAAESVRAAEERVAETGVKAAEARSDAAKSVQRAEGDAAAGVEQALEREDAAERSLTASKAAATKARADSAKSVAKAEADAAESVAAAQERADSAERSYTAAADASRKARADSAKSVAKAEADAAESVAAAQERADSAERSYTAAVDASRKARIDSAKSVAKAEASAEKSVNSAREQAQRSVSSALEAQVSANTRLQRSTRDLAREQGQLNERWEDGRRALEDLQDQVDDNALDQRQAAFDLADAEKDLNEALATGDADKIARAQLAYDKQIEKIDQLTKQTHRLGVDNAEAQAAGVSGSKEYLSALDRVNSAQEQVNDAALAAGRADHALYQARLEGAASIQAAETEGAAKVAEAREAGAERIASADARLDEARRSRDVAEAAVEAARAKGAQKVADAREQGAERIASADARLDEARRSRDAAEAAVETARMKGAEKVADAREQGAERIASADARVAEQQIAADQARAAVEDARAKGQQRVDDAREQGQRAIAAADAAALDATRALTRALADTGTQGSASVDKVAQAFANLSPAAAAFVTYLWSLKPALDALRASAASGLFPPIQAGLVALMGQFAALQGVVGLFAAAVGAALGYVLTQLASPFWVGFFQALAAVAGPTLMGLAVVLMQAAQAAAGLILALLPFVPQGIAILGIVAQLVAAWTPFIALLVGALLPVATQVLLAFLPLGPVLAALGPILAVLGSAFASVLVVLLQALAPILVALTPLIVQLALAFAGQLVSAIVSLTPFLVGLATFMSQHPQLVLGVITVLTGLFGAWQAIATVVGALLTPLGLLRLGLLLTGASVGRLLAPLGTVGAAIGGFIGRIFSSFSIMGLARTGLGLLGQAVTFLLRSVLGALGPLGWVAIILTTLYATSEPFRIAVGQLLGVLLQLAGAIISSLAPVLTVVSQIMTVVGQVFGGVAAGLATALVPVVQALAAVLQWLTPVIVPLVDVFLAVRAAMLLWAAAQWALNLAMAANPIGLIIIAVAALVGAVVWAYQNFSWFRTAVDAVGAAFVWVWQNVLQPVVDFFWSLLGPAIRWVGDNWSWLSTVLGILVGPVGWVILAFTNFRDVTVAVLSAIGDALLWVWQSVFVPAFTAIAAVVSWAWTNVIAPVLDFIGLALRVLGAVIFVVLVAPFLIAWNLISAAVVWAWENVIKPAWDALVWVAQNILAPVVMWLYANVFKPIWDAIGAAIQWVWNNVIKPVWDFLGWYINTQLIPWLEFLYNNVVKPIWDAIGAAISWVWNNIIKPIWDLLGWYVNTQLIPWMQFLYYSVIKPIWDAIGAAIQWVWQNVIKPAWDAIAGGLTWLGDRFRDGVGLIGQLWAGIKSLLAKPINFMIDVVWNHGVVPAWNAVAGLVGLGPIQPLGLIPEMATGGEVSGGRRDAIGRLHGPGTGTSDSILAAVTGGGGLVKVSTGETVMTARVSRQVPGFLAALNSGDGEALQAAGGTRAGKANQNLFRGRSGLDQNPGIMVPRFAVGGPIEDRIGAAKRFLSTEATGIPYVYGGGTSRGGTDCSGMQAMVTHILSGRSPYSGRIGTTASMPWGGFVPGINGQYAVGNKPSDHMAGTLAGQNVEQHGPSGTPFSFPSRWGADNGYFPQKFHLAEVGGNFVSGGNGGGGFFNFMLDLARKAFDGLTNPAIDLVRRVVGPPPPRWREAVPAVATKMRDTVRDFVFGKAEEAGGGEGGVADPAQVRAWVGEALGILGWPQSFAAGIMQQIATESGGNPGAVQHGYVDVNTGGNEARGIMQVIPPTFAANMLPGRGNIMNPVDNIIAGSRYAMGKYGAAWFNPGPQHSHGYDSGGVARGMGIMLKQTMRPERVLDPDTTDDYDRLGPLVREMEAGRPPSVAGATLTRERIAAMTPTPAPAFPDELRLSSDTALRLDGDGLLRIVDGRLDAVTDRYNDRPRS